MGRITSDPHKILRLEQTTQDAVRHLSYKPYYAETEKTTSSPMVVFSLFLSVYHIQSKLT
jgi:hypothetical protein